MNFVIALAYASMIAPRRVKYKLSYKIFIEMITVLNFVDLPTCSGTPICIFIEISHRYKVRR